MIQLQSGEPKGSLLAYLLPEKTHKGFRKVEQTE